MAGPIRVDEDEDDWFLDRDGALICGQCAFETQEKADCAVAEGYNFLFDDELPVERVPFLDLNDDDFCEECGIGTVE